MKELNLESMKTTVVGKTYWNNEGAYNAEYVKLYDELVPSEGCAKTLHGELIRAISRLSYEYFNNGNCNARVVDYHEVEYECPTCAGAGYVMDGDEEVECPDCGGSGYDCIEEETDPVISDFYQSFIDLIVYSIKDIEGVNEVMSEIEEIILYSPDTFTDDVEHSYSLATDYVMFYVLNTEDSELPEWYAEMMKGRIQSCKTALI